MRKVVSLLLLFVLAGSLGANAQNYSGIIRGTVTDSTGAVVSGATVTATRTDTGATRTTQSSSSGEYVFPDLPASVYEIHVKQSGFKEFVARSIELHVSTTAQVNAKLDLGAASEQVTVEANALQVQTNSAQVGEVVNGQQVRELPLNGRSFAQLTLLQPGVAARDGLNTRDKGLLSGVDMSVNGNPVTNNLWLLDGANNNDLGSNRTILIYPSIDAIAEFKFLRDRLPEVWSASSPVQVPTSSMAASITSVVTTS
jgi:carboxypeptidase family protein